MKYKYWMATLEQVNSRKRIQLETLLGSARDVYFASINTIEKTHMLTEKELEWMKKSRQGNNLDIQWEQFQKSEISFVSHEEELYPNRLREIYQPPYALFYKGQLPDFTASVGIVGARMCSEYGRSIAQMLGKVLAEHGFDIISGMALGIDSAAHAGALQSAGRTFAVLGCGADICYPKSSANIYQNIIKSNGGILSEYSPGTQPLAYRFPERNRIISALSDTLVVVEAKEKSGSLITVDCALEQGKDVYAVPGRYGDKLSEGCNRLICQGAGILYDVNIFVEQIKNMCKNSEKSIKSEHISLEKDEMLLYSCLDLHPKFINDIIEETGLHLLRILQIIDDLKKTGMVQETFQNYYCRCL